MRMCYLSVGIISFFFATSSAICEQKPAPENSKPTNLRLFNTELFGKQSIDAVVLLQPPRPDTLDPETVMVDLNKGRYYAATVNYPRTIGFEQARRSLNNAYKKWEKKTFANDPIMGIWRNEDEKFSIQLSHDGFNITVIYISFSLITDDKLERSISRVAEALQDEEDATHDIVEMCALMKREDFAKFYQTLCHPQFQSKVDKDKFVELMRSEKGKRVTKLFDQIDDAIKQDKEDALASGFRRDATEYHLALIQEEGKTESDSLRQLKLKKSDGTWKLSAYEE